MTEVINRTIDPNAISKCCVHQIMLDDPCVWCAAEYAPSNPAIAVGDVVTLTAGGADMTVLHISDNAGVLKAVVAWFDNDLHFQQAPGMPIAALKKVR